MIRVSAPGKLMLFGEHSAVYNRPCLAAAVDQRIFVFLEKTKNKKIYIFAPDVGVKNYVASLNDLIRRRPKGTGFITTAIKNFFQQYPFEGGFKIETKSEFSNKYGLGSSSAVTVAVIKGLAELFKIKITNRELFNLAYKTVLDVQKKGSGFDLAAAVYGGVLYFRTGGKVIKKLKVKKLPLLVVYSGKKADTSVLIEKVYKKFLKEPAKINKIFSQITKIVESAKIEIERSNWRKVGELMNLNQKLLKKLGVSSKRLDSLISTALKAGAYGAKLSGAGGGDCIIILAPPKKLNNLKIMLKKTQGEILEMKIPAKGTR